MLRHFVPYLVVFAFGSGYGCLLALEAEIACGDGTVDVQSGEACDPRAPQEAWACGESSRISGCDASTCTCTVCGDDRVDAGEECDGVATSTCNDGSPFVRCINCRLDASACPTCGNGTLDEGEECDPGITSAQSIACDELVSEQGRPFSAGIANACDDDCTWNRSSCTFCGNGLLESIVRVESGFIPPEVCDGQLAQADALTDHCRTACADSPVSPRIYDCHFTCAHDCLGLEAAREDPQCCLVEGEACPDADDDDVCCVTLRDDFEGDPCRDIIEAGGAIRQVCR